MKIFSKKVIRSIICFIICASFSVENPLWASESVLRDSIRGGSLHITMDPRTELISIIQYISSFRINGYRLLTDFDFEYRKRVDRYFAPFKNHPVVKLLEELSPKGFLGDAPPALMIRLSSPPELNQKYPLPDRLLRVLGNQENVEEFLDRLRQFVEDSRFLDFFKDNQDEYAKIIDVYMGMIGNHNYIERLENYVGMTQRTYNIILVPLYGPFGFSLFSIDGREGPTDVYNICGPQRVENGIPEFGTEHGIGSIFLHEFAHSFCNPLIDKYRDRFDESVQLYAPIKDRARALGYGTEWIGSVKEMVTDSVTVRLEAREWGEAYANERLYKQKKEGWVYMPAICERLEEYERNRDRYRCLEDFMPQLTGLLQELAETNLSDDFFFIPFDGTISSVRGNLKSLVIIVPTQEDNTNVQKKIHQYAEKMRDERHPRMKILTDEKALAEDLSQASLVVFGTLEGNLFLKKIRHCFVFKVLPNAITADKEYSGTDLRLITTWPHPQNPKKGMVIYTAQRAEDIIGIRDLIAWDEDYVVGRGTKVLKSGIYNKKTEKWGF